MQEPLVLVPTELERGFVAPMMASAAACRLAGVPLDIVRGISNTAGDRDTSCWQIEQACRAAGALAATLLGDRP